MIYPIYDNIVTKRDSSLYLVSKKVIYTFVNISMGPGRYSFIPPEQYEAQDILG